MTDMIPCCAGLLVCLIALSIANLPSYRVFGKLVQQSSQISNSRQVQTSYNTNYYQQAFITTNTTTWYARDDNKIQCSLNGADIPTCRSHPALTSNASHSVVSEKLCQPATADTTDQDAC